VWGMSYLALIVIPVKFFPYLANIVIPPKNAFRLYIAMVIFTLLYISVNGIKSLSLYDITI
jgi:hypothetical protein